MPYPTARAMHPDAIPVIDLSALTNGRDRQGVANALHSASEGLGFIYVKGHGIPEAQIQAARSAALTFFSSPEASKRQVLVSQQHRGWLKPGGAKMHDDAKADLKESFIWGHQDAFGHTTEDHPLRGRNQWPNWIPQLQTAATQYFTSAHNVAHELMRGFALGLGLHENFFLQTAERPLSRASFVYYPAQDESCAEDQFGVAPHTDFGVLTVLCQDNTGGLQVQDAHGDWIEAPPIEGTLIINVGDLLNCWTAGAYKSTPHRVVNSSGTARLSLVLAFDPNPETVIDSTQIFGGEPHPEYPSTTCGNYLIERFAKAFAYRDQTTAQSNS